MPQHRMTTEEFKNKVYTKHGDKVEILSEYIGQTEPIDILYHCEKHGDIYKTLNAKNIFGISFQPCKECDLEKKSISGHNKFKTKEELYKRLKKYIEEQGGNLISKKWTKAKDDYMIECGEGHIFITTADCLLGKKQWCPYCYGRKGDFQEEIENIVESKNGILLSRYSSAKTHVKVRCNIHNYEWEITPSNLRKGRWCPICNLPYSEKVVYDYLINNKYIFKIQYTFDDLKSENDELLKFDFAILDNLNNVLGIIEIDDQEHRYNTKQPRRLKSRERDIQKNKYCKNNKIPIFRLEYKLNKKYLSYDWYYNYINNTLYTYLIKISS